jgi:hypothetical protein
MIQVARQRIQVGIVHAGLTVTVASTDNTFQVTADDQVLIEVPRTGQCVVERCRVFGGHRVMGGVRYDAWHNRPRDSR